MKNLNSKRTNKKVILVVCALIAVLIIAGLTWWSLRAKNQSSNNTDSSQDKQELDKKKTDSDQETQGSTENDKPAAPVPQPQGKSLVDVTIPSANQNEGVLQVRVSVGIVDNSGTCTLSMKGPAGQSVVKTVKTQALSSTSTCQGFDVPVSELAPGSWSLSVLFENSTTKGTAESTVSIK